MIKKNCQELHKNLKIGQKNKLLTDTVNITQSAKFAIIYIFLQKLINDTCIS